LESFTGDNAAIDTLAPSVEDEFEGLLSESLLSDKLNNLLPDQRQTVELRILRGLSIAETAVIMGRSEDAVRALLARALERLRKEMEDDLE